MKRIVKSICAVSLAFLLTGPILVHGGVSGPTPKTTASVSNPLSGGKAHKPRRAVQPAPSNSFSLADMLELALLNLGIYRLW